MESLQVAEEEVVESSSNKLCDIYTFVAKGCFPQTMNPLRKKNLKRYAQKFIIDGKDWFLKISMNRASFSMMHICSTSVYLHMFALGLTGL